MKSFIPISVLILCGLVLGCVAPKEATPSGTEGIGTAETYETEDVLEEPSTGGDSGILTSNGLLTVQLNFQRSGTSASNQYAVWIESMDGRLVKTLFAPNFTANGGYAYREDSIPTWVAKANPAQMPDTALDAVTSATPVSGHQEYIWNGTDENGNIVEAGEYKVCVEGTLYWSSVVLFSGTFTFGGENQSIEMTPVFTEDNNDTNKNMITQVTANYAENSISVSQEASSTIVNGTMQLLGGLTPEEALEYMKNTEGLIIIDVREPQWLGSTWFTDALLIPHTEIAARYEEIPSGYPVILNCGAGVNAPKAYQTLVAIQPDIPQLSYIAGSPRFTEYNDWKQSQ